MSEASYGERVLRNLVEQCAVRGVDLDDFLAHVEAETGIAVTAMDVRGLRRLQQNVDAHFRSLLGGQKRAPGVAPETWPASSSPAAALAAARAGLALADVEGTGKDGAVTVADVEKAAKAAKE